MPGMRHSGFPGATRPQTDYFRASPARTRVLIGGGYAPPDLFFPGLPGPDPGHFSLAGKVTKRAPKPMVLESFV